MKKQLFIGAALIVSAQMFAQTSRVKPSGEKNAAELIAQKFEMENNSVLNAKPGAPQPAIEENPYAPALQPAPITNVSWSLLSGSMNMRGQIVTNSKPLQYNERVNAVSFVHRKSQSYTPNPSGNSNSGNIVAEISSDWGASWDSTLIWDSPTEWARYPQGGIYVPPGTGQTISDAYIVGSGPATGASSWIGSWYASKKLATPGSALYNNVSDVTPNAQQFISFSQPSYPATQARHGWPRYGFSSTNDGVVRSLALIQNDQTTLSTMRGVAVVKGTFSAGAFNWTTDTLTPDALIMTSGNKVLSSDVQMAWNRSGTVGYAVMMGCMSTATNSNRAYQPIIYKTTNSGNSWAGPITIDFNSPAMDTITQTLSGVNGGTLFSAPYVREYDLVVDSMDKLHIAAIFLSTSRSHKDSLGYVATYSISGNQYFFPHYPGVHPFLWDIVGDGTSQWQPILIDSMWTEDPGSAATSFGFNHNPWDVAADNNAKVNIESRLQLSRTPDGKYITFSWAETDTNFTTGFNKYNTIPDIKVRSMYCGNGTYELSPTEINVSKVSVANGGQMTSGKAFLHYMSPVSGSQSVTPTGTEYKVPFTITNSLPLVQLSNNRNIYANATLSFNYIIPGFEEHAGNIAGSVLFPNPAQGYTTLKLELNDHLPVDIGIYSLTGQMVSAQKFNGTKGSNEIQIGLNNLSSGVYLMKVTSGNTSGTKKLIVQ